MARAGAVRLSEVGAALALGLGLFEAWGAVLVSPFARDNAEILELFLAPALLAAVGAGALAGIALAHGAMARVAVVDGAAATTIGGGLASIDAVASDPASLALFGAPALLLLAGASCGLISLLARGAGAGPVPAAGFARMSPPRSQIGSGPPDRRSARHEA